MPAKKKSVVYRVRGLSPRCGESDFRAILESCLSPDEAAAIQTKVSIIPSCYHDDITSTALVTLDAVPEFLSELDESPLSDWPVETEDGDINFDKHFHGFTQLYPTPQGKEIAAE
jgi:protein SERAC1